MRRWLVQQVVNATTTDSEVNQVFQAVMQMEAHPSVLGRADVVWRSIRARGDRWPDPTPPLIR
ncbi:hypothetical protein [Actinoplanes sp. NPDC049265]|uniref:hypothetical protein n=1 Tax=Actinoplanes sp. NPDC049265 TaxID=3363902 RepID=UPI00371DAE28